MVNTRVHKKLFSNIFNVSIIRLNAVITNHEVANGLRRGWTEQEVCDFAIKKSSGTVINLEQIRKKARLITMQFRKLWHASGRNRSTSERNKKPEFRFPEN